MFGSPAAILILALGKLGGRELNHSSMSISFFFTARSELSPRLSHHQWFTDWPKRFWKRFPHATRKARLFRIFDLRLRPEGSAVARAVAREHGKLLRRFCETWDGSR